MKMHTIRAAALGALAIALALPPSSPSAETADKALGPGPLAAPPRQGGMTLVEALWKRRSVRKFEDRPVTREQLGFVLSAAAGVNRPEEKRRTVPSAWGSNAVSVYVTSPSGTVVYDPLENALTPVDAARDQDLREKVAGAEFTRKAPAVLILVADYRRFGEKASREMLPQMANCEAGAMAQDIYLAAGAMGLGTVVTADVRPEASAALGLGSDAKALYTLPLGHPAEAPAGEKR